MAAAAAAAAASSSVPKSNVTEHRGDLFKGAGDSASLGHCVSRCMSMSKGIATEFKKRFGRVQELLAQNVGIGGVATLEMKDPKRFVFYLVTKEKYYGKPTYDAISASIDAMRDLAVKHGIKRLCLPRIGCGLDGLQWAQVREMLHKAFLGTTCVVDIYYL
jgi:O-acetyl-ADP-ribose deacetylase (regulator of RNase III)